MNLSDLDRSLILMNCVFVAIYGSLIGCFALYLTGGGHGFFVVMLSALAIILVPLGNTAMILRKRRVGLILATLSLILTSAIDILIFSETSGVKRVRGGNSYWFEIWFILWTIWRLPVVWVLLSRLFRRRQPV